MSQVPIVRTESEVRRAVGEARRDGKRIGFVPTMGALHDGHLSLMRAARAETDYVVVSIFVNPTQFGPKEDFERYPRMLDADRRRAEEAGVDLIFAPEKEMMYPPGFATYVVQERLTERLCGVSRPHHFHGVCTVVSKLFNLVQPDVAYFGQKDYQQSVVIRRMVADLNIPVEIRVLPIVREPDGLAMSSRNQYLSPEERQRAVCLFRALQAAEQEFARGERRGERLERAMVEEISKTPEARLEYAEIVHPDTLERLEIVTGEAVAVIAARIGSTRLIDNTILRANERSSV